MLFQNREHIIDSDLDDRKPALSPRDLALYLGYDLELKEDLQRLAKNATWLNTSREKNEKMAALRPPFIIGLSLAVISGIITLVVALCLHSLKL